MKNLFEAAALDEVKERLRQMRSDSERLWGKMNAAQALAHCAAAMEWAGLLGRFAKSMIAKDKLMPRNSMTDKNLQVRDERDFEVEWQRLRGLIERFVAVGLAGCAKHPQSLFDPMTPME